MKQNAKRVNDEGLEHELALITQRYDLPPVVITDDNELTLAAGDLSAVKAEIKRLTDWRLSITRPLDQSKRLTMRMFAVPLAALERAEDMYKAAMCAWREKQEAQQAELQRQADAIALKKAEEERGRLAAEALAAAKEGDAEAAEVLLAAADEVQPEMTTVRMAMSKTDGISYRENWHAEVVDAAQVPREFLIVDMQALNAYARARKAAAQVPGVRFVCEKSVAAQSR